MVMLRQNGHLPSHLSGLLDVFKSKIGTNLPVPIGVSAHFFYRMKSWDTKHALDSFPPELYDLIRNEDPSEANKAREPHQSLLDWSQCVSHISLLPFGSVEDPFLHLDFVSGWHSLTEDVVVDSASYSDLEPENAQEWYFSLKTDQNADFRLKELVEEVWSLRGNNKTIEQVLGKSIEDNRGSYSFHF
jgi:hypothetical protein